jgi:hypothetical protein
LRLQGAARRTFLERTLRKTVGRLAAVVAASALITFAAAPAALADETSSPTAPTSEPSTTGTTTPTTSASASASTSSSAPATTETTSSATSTTGASSSTSTSAGTTESSKPTATSSSRTSSTPQEPPYQDGTGYGLDLGNGKGILIIACAAGEPTDVTSPDFDIVDGPYQEEQDGRYWDYLVQLHGDLTFASGQVQADWKCGSDAPQGGGGASGGTTVPPVAGSGDAAGWQASNGGSAQVAYAPKSGVETGFGGTAQG